MVEGDEGLSRHLGRESCLSIRPGFGSRPLLSRRYDRRSAILRCDETPRGREGAGMRKRPGQIPCPSFLGTRDGTVRGPCPRGRREGNRPRGTRPGPVFGGPERPEDSGGGAMGCDSCTSGSCSTGSCSSENNGLPPGILQKYKLSTDRSDGYLVWIEVVREGDSVSV